MSATASTTITVTREGDYYVAEIDISHVDIATFHPIAYPKKDKGTSRITNICIVSAYDTGPTGDYLWEVEFPPDRDKDWKMKLSILEEERLLHLAVAIAK